MSKKKQSGESDEVHDLVLFKSEEDQDIVEEDTYSFEAIDQEDKIKLVSELVPFGANYRYSVLLVNQSLAPITEVKIRVKYPKFLSLNRYSPPSLEIDFPKNEDKKIAQINLDFDELNENGQKQINLYFSPSTLNNEGKLSTYVTFVNNKDYVRVLNSEPAEIVIKPISIEPKIMPSVQIQKFLKTEGIKKAIKSLGIGVLSDLNLALQFPHIEQLLSSVNLQLITKDEEKRIMWFFGSELESKEDILVIGQIISNKIEFLAASKNHPVLISLLTQLSNDFAKRLIGTATITDINQIYDLECRNCGVVLPFFPKKGEAVECGKCHKEEIIW